MWGKKKVFDYKNNKHKANLKNAFQYTVGTDKHYLTLLIRVKFRVKKYLVDARGQQRVDWGVRIGT